MAASLVMKTEVSLGTRAMTEACGDTLLFCSSV
jgi:hypothetical protein